MVDVVVLWPPEGVSAVSPPTALLPCRPGPRPVDLNPGIIPWTKKISITAEKKIILIFIFEVFGFCMEINEVFILHLASPPSPRGYFLAVRYHNKSGMRASGLIPVIPLTTIIKILSFNCVLQNKQSFTDTLAGVITSIYTSQRRYTTYCTI